MKKMGERLGYSASAAFGNNGLEPSPRPQNMTICVWCANRIRHECQTECQPEGRYRHLVPDRLPEWEQPPSPPSFREMLDMSPVERLAMLWLLAYYLDWGNKKDVP